MTVESFVDVHDDPRISEIVIIDDDSESNIYEELKTSCSAFSKVKLFRNKSNRGCYTNKATALSYSNNDWCILLDSDNKIQKDYLDKIFEAKEWDDNTIYTPDFAFPHFDFRTFAGALISKKNVAAMIDLPMAETMFNAANYFVNKNEYLKVWDENTEPVTSDSIYLISRWLEADNRVQVVKGLQYFHKVHPGSHYQNYKHLTPIGFHEEVLNKIRQMQ